MKTSAGILIYRFRDNVPEFFLVHPGGPFWKNKDEGAWSIPKGEFENEEAITAAKREFREETGFEISTLLTALEPVKQKSGKVIHVFAGHQDIDADKIRSNSFTLEWPPKSGKLNSFPEVDKAGWFNFSAAKQKIFPGQLAILEELFGKLTAL